MSSSLHLMCPRAIQEKYPELIVEDLVYNVRFNSARAAGRVGPERIDVVRDTAALFRRVLERYSVVIPSRTQPVRLPTTEAAVALKYAAVVSPNRGNESQPQDRVDLLALVTRHRKLKLEVLRELGDLVYPGGGKALEEACQAIWQGKRVSL
ncbi:MAG: hypothetical protein ABW321_19510 [Polyangiales bacterium]